MELARQMSPVTGPELTSLSVARMRTKLYLCLCILFISFLMRYMYFSTRSIETNQIGKKSGRRKCRFVFLFV